MKFSDVVKQAQALLRHSGRVTFGALKMEFDLDDDQLTVLKEELLFSNRQIKEIDGRGLVWSDDEQSNGEEPARASNETVNAHPAETSTSQAERRQITVMFCDLVGSTALSEKLDPEDLRELLTVYQKAAGKVIENFDGHIAQYLGDGLMAYFGWPSAHEEDAARAVRAGLEILEVVNGLETAEPLMVRIGITTGPVVVGATGAGDASVPSAAVGETPNIAARLQSLAGANEIVIGPITQRLAGAAFNYDDLGEQILKGIAEPLRAWRVTSKSAIEDRFEARTGGALTPLVGRDSEIALLLERWAGAKEGEGQVVLLSGEPGIGKSRITEALRERIAKEPHIRLRYQCSPYYSNSAFYPIIGQLERAAGFLRDDSPDAKLDKLETLLKRGTSQIEETASLVAALLSLPVDRYPPLNLSPQLQKEKIIEVLAEQTAGLTQQNPVLMIFEDAHWADPSTLDLLRAVIERIQNLTVLLVITYRPEFEPPWPGYSHVTFHSLNRLSRRRGAEMVNMLTGGKPLADDVVEQIISNTDGVPLFVEELTKTVLEASQVQDYGSKKAAEAPAQIPATLHDSLMARLDRLESGKDLAQLAACLGRDFNHRLLEAVARDEHPDFDESLTRLIDAELLYRNGRPPDASYSFKHALVQETAYQSLLKSRRRSIHGQIAATLKAHFDDVVAAEPEILAHHFTEAGLNDQAIPYWQQAGERAVKRSASVEAIGHFGKALEVLQELPQSAQRDAQELRLQVALAVPLAATTGFASAEMEVVYTRARELCEHLGEAPQLFPVLYGLWDFYLVRAEHKAAYKEAQQLLTLVENVEDSGLRLEAHRATGSSLYYKGEFVSARKQLDAATALYDPRRHRAHIALYRQEPGVACFSYGAWNLWCLGYAQQALESMGQAINIAEQCEHPFSLAWALNFSGRLHEFRREGQMVQQRADDVITVATEQGFTYWLAWGTLLRGCALAEQGQPSAGIVQIREGLAAIQATDTIIARSQDLGLLAKTQLALGEINEGLATVAEAKALVEHTDERLSEAELYRLTGELTLRSGTHDRQAQARQDAEVFFQKAIDIARHQQAKSWELRAATSLARLWTDQGKHSEAYQLLSEVYGWFTEGFDTKDLQDAKDLLADLG